jgi:hypothetical protein
MPIQIINGFPQFYEMGYSYGIINGKDGSEYLEYQDIDITKDLEGDSITCSESETHLLIVNRSGSILSSGSGFSLIADNIIRIYPNLLPTEFLEIKKLHATADIGNIPVTYVLPEQLTLKIKEDVALCWTDNSQSNSFCHAAFVLNGKTTIRTTFVFDINNVEVFINGTRVNKQLGVWKVVDENQIELDGNYSSINTSVEIVNKTVIL